MAFIPVQFNPLGNPISEGVDKIFAARRQQQQDAFKRSQALLDQQNQQAASTRADRELALQEESFKRTGKRQEAEDQRQGAEDFSKIYEAAGKDPAMARELAKQYGYEIVDSPAGPVAVKSAAPPAAPTAEASQVDAISGPGSTPQAAAPFAPWAGQRINQPGASAVQPPSLVGQGVGMPDFLADEIASNPPANPLGLARNISNVDLTPEQAFKLRGIRPGPGDVQDQHAELMGTTKTALAGPGDELEPFPGDNESTEPTAAPSGNPILRAFQLSKGNRKFTIDPATARAAEEERFNEQLKLRSAAPEIRAAKAAEEAQKKRDFTAGQNQLYKSEPLTFANRKELANIMAQSRVNAAAVSQNSPEKQDAATRQDLGSMERQYNDWIRANQLNIDSKTNKRLQTASANLNSGNAMQQREAAESLVSIFKGGGQVTKASQDLLLKHLSGIVGDAQTFLQHMQSGHYGARELQVLQQAAQGALDEQNERMTTAQQSFRDTFGPGSGFENLGGNVNQKGKGFFRQFGIDMPNVYEDQAAPQAVLGSAMAAKKAGKQPKINPLTAKSRKQESDADFLKRVLGE